MLSYYSSGINYNQSEENETKDIISFRLTKYELSIPIMTDIFCL